MTHPTATTDHAVRRDQPPEPDLHPVIVVGGGQVATAITAFAGALGWVPTVTESLVDVKARLTTDCSVVVLSHDPDLDAPSLAAALTGGVGYVGAMGARRTQNRRRDWLVANGIDDQQLAAVHGPVGLDIGADTPAEIALAIVSEMVAVRRNAPAAGSIADRPRHRRIRFWPAATGRTRRPTPPNRPGRRATRRRAAP